VKNETLADLVALGHRKMTLRQAIRANCLDCSNGMAKEVADCLVSTCPSFPYRMGRNPWLAPASDAKREAARKARAARRSIARPVSACMVKDSDTN
jgi:hypothetical protein